MPKFNALENAGKGQIVRWMRAPVALLSAAFLVVSPAGAQDVESFDPDEAYQSARDAAAQANEASTAIDADLIDPQLRESATEAAQQIPQNVPAQTPSIDPGVPMPVPPRDAQTQVETGFEDEFAQYSDNAQVEQAENGALPAAPEEYPAQANADTYGQDDLIGAAEGVFGKGAEGLAGLIEDLLRKQGEPNGYIVGREGGGAFIFGVRYGSGTLHHRIEGERKVYWTGPSLGLDAGANAGNTFVLVYNLYDTEDVFRRYPAGEGQAYLVGGLHVSYMRRGDVVLIPIRVGAGLRLGINAGYMRFSKKQRWLPF